MSDTQARMRRLGDGTEAGMGEQTHGLWIVTRVNHDGEPYPELFLDDEAGAWARYNELADDRVPWRCVKLEKVDLILTIGGVGMHGRSTYMKPRPKS